MLKYLQENATNNPVVKCVYYVFSSIQSKYLIYLEKYFEVIVVCTIVEF